MKEEPTFTVSNTEFISAMKKAYKIWQKIVLKQKKWRFSTLYQACYVAKNPSGEPYVVVAYCSRSINSATGMFRFPTEETAQEFINLMGNDILMLFPDFIYKTPDLTKNN